jgi:hypothetical protein
MLLWTVLRMIQRVRWKVSAVHDSGGPTSSIQDSFMSSSLRMRAGAGKPLFKEESSFKESLEAAGRHHRKHMRCGSSEVLKCMHGAARPEG